MHIQTSDFSESFLSSLDISDLIKVDVADLSIINVGVAQRVLEHYLNEQVL